MANNKNSGIYQLENGNWAFRFVMTVDGQKVSSRKSTDEFGNKLKTKKQAIKARESAMAEARLAGKRKHEIGQLFDGQF